MSFCALYCRCAVHIYKLALQCGVFQSFNVVEYGIVETNVTGFSSGALFASRSHSCKEGVLGDWESRKES